MKKHHRKKFYSAEAGHTRKHLKDLGVKPSKKRGQNFVIQPALIDAIIEFGEPDKDEAVVEIGPGLGALTEKLLHAQSLTVIEIEEEFSEKLKIRFPNITVLNQDFRIYNLEELAKNCGQQITVFGNIPYVYSTDIIFHLIRYRLSMKRAVLLLQKEFGERIAAKPGCKAYGVPSLLCQNVCDVRLGAIFPGDMFYPPTKVDSIVLELSFKKSPCVPVEELLSFEKVIKASFKQRRKKIINSLQHSGLFVGFDLKAVFAEAKLDSQRRPETFSLFEFLTLSRALDEHRQ
jgi:16S rRNA (adenine1518-N6/adenine1519-N6)-dimethyltransferase